MAKQKRTKKQNQLEQQANSLIKQITIDTIISFLGEDLVQKADSTCGKAKVRAALKDAELFIKQLADPIKNSGVDYHSITRKMYSKIYQPFPGMYESRFIAIAVRKYMIDLYEKRTGMFEDMWDTLAKFYRKHQKVTEFLLNELEDKVSKMTSRRESTLLPDSEMTPEQWERLERDSVPIEITKVEGDLRLYHGTSLKNYEQILKDGRINPSNYKDLDYSRVEQESRQYQTIYEQEDGYVFLDSGLDIPLAFGMGGLRKNVLTWAQKEEDLPEEVGSTTDGVIFEIDPTGYKLFYHPGKNEFMIQGAIDLKDTRVMFTHYDDLTITITDEKGETINDLLY